MFVTTVLFNWTKPESAKVLVFIYVCHCSHKRTHDDLRVVHEVDLQHSTKMQIMLWDLISSLWRNVKGYGLVDRHQHFTGTCRLHLYGKRGSLEMSESTYQTTQCHIPEDHSLNVVVILLMKSSQISENGHKCFPGPIFYLIVLLPFSLMLFIFESLMNEMWPASNPIVFWTQLV
jgi:hypothetical protein